MKTIKNSLIVIITLLGINANAQLKVQDNGYVGVGVTGTNTITSNLQVGENTNVYYNNTITSIGADFRIAGYSAAQPYAIITAADNISSEIGFLFRTKLANGGSYEALRISSQGYVGIGNGIIPSYRLDVDGVIRVQTTLYNSDERLKDNIHNLNSPLSSLSGLQGITYKFKANGVKALTKSASADSDLVSDSSFTDTIDTNRLHMGFVAQEVKKVFPHLVYEDKNGILSVDYVSLIPVIVEGMKELKSENVNKDAEIESLIQQVATLQKAIALQEQSIINLQSQK